MVQTIEKALMKTGTVLASLALPSLRSVSPVFLKDLMILIQERKS